MVDYAKIFIKDIDIKKLKHRLEIILKVSENTGEIFKEEIKLHFCTMIIKKDYIEFKGSLHKMYNDLKGIKAPNYRESNKHRYNGYNGNIFTLKNLLEVRDYLCCLFDCTPQQMEFKNIEFGVNLDVSFLPKLFITGLLIHKGKGFEFKYNRNFAQVKHNRYYIKIYSKSYQYKIPNNVLRVEIKLMKSIEINPLGIKTFADFTPKTLNNAKGKLIKTFDEVVYYDNTISEGKLTKVQKKQLKNFLNIRYWLDEVNPNHRDRPKKQLSNFIIKYSKNLKEKIKQEIDKKCVIINHIEKEEKCVIINRLFKTKKNRKCVMFNTLNIGLGITQKQLDKNDKKYINFYDNSNAKKLCAVTGLKLDLENANAEYVRTSTLRYLQKHEKEMFKKLVDFLLHKSYKRPKWENTLITHLAKQIKNRYRYIRKRNKLQLSLF
ncbi:MAG: hypothetical protein KGV44_05960 [Flavobacteriaceae bacterium]|nr:hypothetical protein [Flavobacteriaceae bacterium]